MKLCITARGTTLDAAIDPTFGRTQYFLFVDSENGAIEAIQNEPGAHGAGVQAAQRMVDNGVGQVITGNVGPNAFQGLTAAGIRIATGAEGTAQDALNAYNAGLLNVTAGPTSQGHGGGRK